MYRAAILGCGPRARAHASAYQWVEGGQLVAICDKDEDRLHAFGEQFGIRARYTDLETMLRQEQPDLLHIVTPPTIRVSLLRIASEHNVPAVTVEKPIAIGSEDYKELRSLASVTRSKISVNHQLHFHPRCLELQRVVREGEIGPVRLVDASARLNLSGQGTHVLELVAAFTQGTPATLVFGQCSGASGLEGNHPAPDQATAEIQFQNGAVALFRCGTHAPQISDDRARHMHKRIAVHGERGMVQWTMSWWERTRPDGTLERDYHNYGTEDRYGQVGHIEAMFRWLDDPKAVHPANLNASLDQFLIILGIYTSAIYHEPISLPFEPEDGLLESLKKHLRHQPLA
ncbi:MAG: oxidoreductase [Candidatus Poribacteria bacterium]|nr:MAG: oxidoreductase [Candidatus Poribacteria bacterium]